MSVTGIQKKMPSFGPEKTRAGVGWVELPWSMKDSTDLDGRGSEREKAGSTEHAQGAVS